jgi:hypothetical protein
MSEVIGCWRVEGVGMRVTGAQEQHEWGRGRGRVGVRLEWQTVGRRRKAQKAFPPLPFPSLPFPPGNEGGEEGETVGRR